jgi:signal peptidase I
MQQYYEKYSTTPLVWLVRVILKPLLKVLLLSFLLYLIISTFFLRTFRVESDSMLPGLSRMNRVLASPLSYGSKLPFLASRLPGLSKPQYGDLVICTPPYYPASNALFNTFEPLVRFLSLQKASTRRNPDNVSNTRYMIKRIIGLPGDTIKLKAFAAYIKPQSRDRFYSERELIPIDYEISIETLPETWQSDFPLTGNMEEIILRENEYFLLGDNRMKSNDSRSWGPLLFSRINSRVFYRYWPLNQSARL